jgi:hypothetical protein
MQRTTIDLYRIGTQAVVDLSAVRPGIDVTLYPRNGVNWVYATPSGGASTTELPWKLRRTTSRWWRLPAGSPYDDLLVIRNDQGRHWLWEAAINMPFDDYRAMLSAVSQFFV